MSYEPQTGKVGYRLSVQQQRLWQLAEAGAARMQVAVQLDGDVDAERLAAALHRVVRKHEALRTTFQLVDGSRAPVQVVQDPDCLVVDWAEKSVRELNRDSLPAWLAEEAGRRSTATADNFTMRALLIAVAAGRHLLLLTVSILIADSAAMRVVVADLINEYSGEPRMNAEVLQYVQYVEWQHELLSSADAALGDEVIRSDSATSSIRFPLSVAGQPGQGTIDSILPNRTAMEVYRYATSRNVDPTSVLLAAWHALLLHASGQSTIVVGTSVAGRGHDEMRDCVGPFTRWLGTVSGMDNPNTFNGLVAEIDRQLGTMADVQEFASTAEIIEWTATFECTSRPMPHLFGDVACSIVWEDIDSQPDELRLICVLDPTAETSIVTSWRYRGDRFTTDHVRALTRQYRTLLADLLANSASPIRLARVMDTDARDAVLAMSRAPVFGSSPNRCLHELFEEQVARTPDATAIRSGNDQWSYRELDRRADQAAHMLIARGVGVETLVAVCVGHHGGLFVAVLAVLKAGGTYVPIDPAWPSARKRELVDRAGCRTVLADQTTIDDFPGIGIDLATLPATSSEYAQLERCSVSPDNLAYVMFTSGSTGRPKGVALPHRAVANYLAWSSATYLSGESDGSVAHSSIAFDLTVTSMFAPLTAGKIVNIEPAWRDPFTLSAELATRTRADLCKLTPSHLAIVNSGFSQNAPAGRLDCLVLGGEALSAELVRPWLEHGWAKTVFNEYGPTETAVGCAVHQVGIGDFTETGELSIGRPIDNAETYVLDERLEPTAIGITGEIYVGGAGLARGYLGERALTAERFVSHPFSRDPGNRLYRTGDLGCFGPNGELRFLGRADDQVKVRGVRVEPAEIAAALRDHSAVEQAVILTMHDKLVAYVTATAADRPGLAELRAFLGERLPPQFLPDHIRWLDKIPLTPNGKIDSAALIQATTIDRAAVTEPVDAAELVVIRVFEDLLGTAPVNLDDDYFDLGGHSMLAVQLIARLNTLFDRDLEVSTLFDARPTPRNLALALTGCNSAGWTRSLVPLGGRAEGLPFVCVHPAGGDVLGYREFASSANLRRPVYGLQAPPLDHPAAAQSIEFLADQYLGEILAAGLSGPHLLLGWSMGGLVAFELAHRLIAAGQQVAHLILIDSYLAEQLPTYTETTALNQFAERIERLAGCDLPASLRNERDIYARAAAAGWNPAERERESLTRILHLTRAHLQAAHAYRPRPLHVSGVLIQAADSDADARASAGRSWKSLCTKQFQNSTLPGDHFSLFHAPHVDQLSRHLEQLLDTDHRSNGRP